MDNPHSPIVNVHVVTIASSYSVRTHLGPIFLDLVFPFRWLMELIRMFHALLALHRENVPFSITSIANSKASFVHMPLLVVEGIQFSCVDILLCGSRVVGQFFNLLQEVDYPCLLFANLTCNNLVECFLAQPRVSFSLLVNNPRIQKV